MKPERPPLAGSDAVRPVAQHCAELVRAAPGVDELMPLLERAADRFARAFAPALAPLMGGKVPAIKPQKAKRGDLSELLMFSPDLAANCLMGVGADEYPLLVALDAAAVLRMIDRTFGGRGEAPSPLPDEFPVSAQLMVQRLEGVVADLLGGVLLPGKGEALSVLRRDSSLVELEPFPKDEPLATLEFDVSEPGGDSWLITLALPLPTLSAVFGTAPRPAVAAHRAPADPQSAPFAAVPLRLTAVLVDMAMPMAVLAAIEPGTILPVAVARQVPLKAAGLTIATGTVGAADDRVALQITSAF